MNEALKQTLLAWSRSPDPVLRQHAEHRLSKSDEEFAALAAKLEYPPLSEQLLSAAGAAVAFVASGFALVDEIEQARRLAICQDCEHLDAEAQRCRLCGCHLNIKVWVQSVHCPISKW